jgi:hypothetical protein
MVATKEDILALYFTLRGIANSTISAKKKPPSLTIFFKAGQMIVILTPCFAANTIEPSPWTPTTKKLRWSTI